MTRNDEHQARVRAYNTVVDVHSRDGSSKAFGCKMVETLRARGFVVDRDPETARSFPTMADSRLVGRKGDLHVFVELERGRSSAEFFQDINVENRNGGRYDFAKFTRMPRSMQFQCAIEMASLVRAMVSEGCALGLNDCRWPASDIDVDRLALSVLRIADGRTEREASPLARFNRAWDANRFNRDETGWPATEEYARCGYDLDRDRRPIRNGDTKYHRIDHGSGKGRLVRGLAYTNMNSMWLLVTGAGVHYCGSHELFDCDRPDLEPRRLVPGHTERLEQELASAIKAKAYRRAHALTEVLAAEHGQKGAIT